MLAQLRSLALTGQQMEIFTDNVALSLAYDCSKTACAHGDLKVCSFMAVS